VREYLDRANSDGFSAIHFAALQGNVYLLEYLQLQGANIQLQNDKGLNIMHIGAQANRPETLAFAFLHGFHYKNYIIPPGVSPTETDNDGGTPLHWACYFGGM
jgi:ankyrin repeat protein